MENNNSKMNSIEDIVSAIKTDKVFMTVIEILCNTTSKIEEIINDYEGLTKDYEGDNDCINISVDNFKDIELFYIGCFKSDIIDFCNYHKPRYELIDIDVVDDIVILKVKV